MKETMRFLRELKRNNNREWFAASRNRYEHALETRSALVARLIGAVAQVDPSAGCLTERDCTYRIYRDTRFSTDKTPYKTHMGIFINPPYGKKSPPGRLLLPLRAGEILLRGRKCLPSAEGAGRHTPQHRRQRGGVRRAYARP
jgi:TIGR02453 family protein